ncbi:MAG: HAD family phosphatase [Brachybacterium sp.]|nr:HAD family phosphatase [Brachybacterium sp.]
MSRARRRRTPARPTIVLDYGGVLSAGHDPVPDVHALLGGDQDAIRDALWAHRTAYDLGRLSREEYWARVAAAAGVQDLTAEEVEELQTADDRYFLQLDARSRELLHDLARAGHRLVLLSNASAAFGEALRRAEWFEVFDFAVVSGEEGCVKPDAEIYEILLQALAHETGGVTVPGSVIFFDDRPENIEAARGLGIDAHLWPRNGDDHGQDVPHGSDSARRILADRGIALDT